MTRIGIGGLAAAAFLACSSLASAAEPPIKIGSFITLTGPAGFLGTPMKQVFEYEIADLNKAGGLLGRKIELIIYDDGGAVEKSTSFAKRLIEDDKVDLIIGGTLTPSALAAIPLVEKAEIPMITWAGALGIVEPAKKWVFKVSQTDRMAAEKVLSDLKARGLTKLALISENVGFGKSGRDQTVLLAPAYGIEIVADETYAPRDPDVTVQLTKIKNTAGVQAVFNWGFGQGPAIVTRNYRQIGVTVPLYHAHAVASKEFIKLAGDAANGIRLPAAGVLVADQLPVTDPQYPVVTTFKKIFESRAKTEISTYAGHGWDSLQIALAAIQRAGTTDKAKVRDEIEKTRGFIGTAGTFNMSPTDHMGLTPSAFHMVEVKNGDWSLIK
ncbi:MAG: ABC transporter substrate-binding protein [Rhodospirillales bacterium]|nr:ABC transporter substrate-binding protein [Rhodospirillales bacterium]